MATQPTPHKNLLQQINAPPCSPDFDCVGCIGYSWFIRAFSTAAKNIDQCSFKMEWLITNPSSDSLECQPCHDQCLNISSVSPMLITCCVVFFSRGGEHRAQACSHCRPHPRKLDCNKYQKGDFRHISYSGSLKLKISQSSLWGGRYPSNRMQTWGYTCLSK